MRFITFFIILVCLFYANIVFALTDAQRAEQRRQQRAAQRAYQASANTYNDVSRTAGTYKQGAEIIRDTVKEATPSQHRDTMWGWSDSEE